MISWPYMSPLTWDGEIRVKTKTVSLTAKPVRPGRSNIIWLFIHKKSKFAKF